MDKSSYISMSEEARLRRDEVRSLKIIANNLTVLAKVATMKAGLNYDVLVKVAQDMALCKNVNKEKEE